LIRLAREFRVDIAIDLRAIQVVTPLIHRIVAVGIDELAQGSAIRSFDDPTDMIVELLGDDLALGDLEVELIELGFLAVEILPNGPKPR